MDKSSSDAAAKPLDTEPMSDLWELPLTDQFDKVGKPVRKKKLCPWCPDTEATLKQPEVPITRLLGLISPKYRWHMVFGVLFSAMQGVVFPGFSIVFGELFNIFYTSTPAQIRTDSAYIAAAFVGLAVYNLATGYLGQMLWGVVGEQVGLHFRQNFFTALLRQEVGYYDSEQTGKMTTILSTNIDNLRSGTGVKVSMWVMFATQALVGVIIAFVYSWKLTLVLIAISPLMALGGVLQMRLLANSTQSQNAAFSDATNLAVQCLNAISTVASFSWEGEATRRYFGFIDQTQKPRRSAVHLSALAWGASFFFMFAVYSLGFWYGAQLVADGIPPPGSTYPPGTVVAGGIKVGDMLIVFFSIIMGAMGLGQMFSLNPEFAACRASAHAVVSFIDRQPKIDGRADAPGITPPIEGAVTFRNVRFSFPARLTDEVLRGINLHLPAGTIVGIVGHSGAGKSTLISLLERFYDPTSGAVLVDGNDLKLFQLHHLRQHIGEEPLLFDLTIADNIRFGKLDATDEEVMEAAKKANAYNFVMGLPKKFDTMAGEGGGLLSGGQKQRIAIARAVLKNPKILLLDEATSALDAESEGLVQDALARLMKGRTTIVVAHRLSTIRDSDLICVLDKGMIVEQGKHMELLLRRKAYYSLVSKQMDDQELAELHRLAAARDAQAL